MDATLPVLISAGEDRVDRPHAVWWVLVLGGLGLLALQGFSAAFYAWWTAHLHALPARAVLTWLFVACVPIHVFEGAYAWHIANRLGLRESAAGWALQCFALGYPSTHLLRKRLKAARS